MGHNNIIELNGKQYDAITGALLGESRVKATPDKRHTTVPPKYRGRVIDGFVRGVNPVAATPTHAKAVHRPAQTKQTAVAAPLPTKQFDIARPKPKRVTPHQAEHSKTLMRSAVKKPNTHIKPAIKPTLPTEMAARPKGEISRQLAKKLSVANIDPLRLGRAKHVPKSHHIRRFNHAQESHVPVPAPVLRPHANAAVSTLPPQSMVQHPSAQVAVSATPTQNATDIFEAALARATSHKQPAPANRHIKAHSFRRRRVVNVLAGVTALAVIGGFIVYLNMPAIELHVASVRAGFNAASPSYAPTGYARIGDIEAKKGRVVMQFRSGDSSYKITQVASDWNSQTLLDYYTDAYGAPEQTVHAQGRTIYLYDDSRATWVNGGVRYEINGNAALNAEDLVSLATSM